MTDKLKRCPFCGEKAVIDRYGASVFFVRCKGCNAQGPAFEDDWAAIKAWNKRYDWWEQRKKKFIVRLLHLLRKG